MRWLVVSTAMITCLTAGCVTSSGTKVTDEQKAAFKQGVTSEAEVIAKLGPPNSTSTQADGTKVDSYANATNTANALNFVPFANIFGGGFSQTIDAVSFTFDSQGILKSISSTYSEAPPYTRRHILQLRMIVNAIYHLQLRGWRRQELRDYRKITTSAINTTSAQKI